MDGDVRLVDLFDKRFVLETFHHVDGDDDFAVAGHEFVHNMHAFTEEAAFAFTALFRRDGEELLEPRRIGDGVFGLFNLSGACFERSLVDILVDAFSLLFGTLAVNRSVFGSAVKRTERTVTALAKTIPEAATFAAAKRAVAKATRAAFAVETAFGILVAGTIFAQSTRTARTETAVFAIAASAKGGTVAELSGFAVVLARAAFVFLFTHTELAGKSGFHCALVFFAHSISINCLATDSPSIFKSLYRFWISPCSTKWSGRPNRKNFFPVIPKSAMSSMTAEP